MTTSTDLLIIGAGPFGLATAAYAEHLGIDHMVVGEPMGFWKNHMPQGMILRSDCDWHLDPLDTHTLDRYVSLLGLSRNEVEPLSLEFYLSYAQWFQDQKRIEVEERLVERLDLDHDNENGDLFKATLDTGGIVSARHVVLALGFHYFKHIPTELAEILPRERMTHACDLVDCEKFSGQTCLVVGGRQSAFETAALLHENGAAAVHIVHRHDTPVFELSDWSWVLPMLDDLEDDPSWFRELSSQQQETLNHRFWVEGRQKLEPWLEPRVSVDTITVWPNCNVIACKDGSTSEIEIDLDNGETLKVDQIILATGYAVDMGRIPFLTQGNISSQLATQNGFPVLDDHFQSSVPGLFVTSTAASQDFGLFFGFTAAARISAKLICQAMAANC